MTFSHKETQNKLSVSEFEEENVPNKVIKEFPERSEIIS